MCSTASWKRLIVPASMAESVKAELQRITGVKRTTDGEGGSTEKIGALTTKSPSKIRQRLGSTQQKME